MKKSFILKLLLIAAILPAAIFFVAKFSGPSILRLYIETGIGDCKKIPILCLSPGTTITNAEVNREFVRELLVYKFPKMDISVPKGFMVIQAAIKKAYYKKNRKDAGDSVIYADHQDPDFLINLFPRLRKQGIKDDYDLMKHTMLARTGDIKTLTDAFFVILKSIFTPDLGDQNYAQMLQVTVGKKKCFINYNVSGPGNYFDCNVFDEKGNFFKIYIKDKAAKLDLDKVLAIVSTARAND